MNDWSVVIPSASAENLNRCVDSILEKEPDLPPERIIVVDDEIDWTITGQWGITIIQGLKPFIFARNSNIGMKYAIEKQDAAGVILMGDDSTLLDNRGFSSTYEISKKTSDVGIISAGISMAGNYNQIWQDKGLRNEPRTLCFICVYIPRSTVEKVGYMDERFTGYGLDDDDYCLRVRNAGLNLHIYDFCKVQHGVMPSVFRKRTGGDCTKNMQIFKDKWGFDNFGEK